MKYMAFKFLPVLLVLLGFSSAAGDWLSEVKEKEEKQGNNSTPFIYPKNSDEFACEVYDQNKCDDTKQPCSSQQICTNGEHNACYAVFTAMDQNNSSSGSGQTNIVMKGSEKL